MFTYPIGADVLAPQGPTRCLAQVFAHHKGFYLVSFDGYTLDRVAADQVRPLPLPLPAGGHHLASVALRAAARRSPLTPRTRLLIHQVTTAADQTCTAKNTTDRFELRLRRGLLGQAAYHLAYALESAQESVDEPVLEEHITVLNEIGVDHDVTAQDLAAEAQVLKTHAQGVEKLLIDAPRIAHAVDAHLERNPADY